MLTSGKNEKVSETNGDEPSGLSCGWGAVKRLFVAISLSETLIRSRAARLDSSQGALDRGST